MSYPNPASKTFNPIVMQRATDYRARNGPLHNQNFAEAVGLGCAGNANFSMVYFSSDKILSCAKQYSATLLQSPRSFDPFAPPDWRSFVLKHDVVPIHNEA